MTGPDELTKAWSNMRSGLLALRDVQKIRTTSSAAAAERRALRKLARHPAFRPPPEPAEDPLVLEYGKWLAASLLERLLDLAVEAESNGGPDRYLDAGRRAIIGWSILVAEGLRPAEVYQRRPEMFGTTPAQSDIARRGRVQHALWIGGNRPDPDARPGIALLHKELSAVASIGSPAHTTAERQGFAYEWQRLGDLRPDAQILIGLLSMFSVEVPVELKLLQEGAEPLPTPLKGTVQVRRALSALAADLKNRNLISFTNDRIGVSASIRESVWSQATLLQLQTWASLAVRVLKSYLPADTHFAETWVVWRATFPHVVSVVAAAERFEVQLRDLPYLLDRASVFMREGEEDAATAIELADHGLGISESLGRPDALWHSWLMGNLAMAHDAAGDSAKAIVMMQEAADYDADLRGKDDSEYGVDLNLLANMLKHAGRVREAEDAFRSALEVMREVYEDDPTDENRGNLVEVLNDYSGFLLRHRSGRRALGRAAENLELANRLTRSRDYGYLQVTLNLAELRKRQDRAEESERLLLELLHDADSGFREASDGQMLGILADLAEVCRDLGKNRDAERYNERAHAYDDELTRRRGPRRNARSS